MNMPVFYPRHGPTEDQGLHYNAPAAIGEPDGHRSQRTCVRKPHFHAGINYDKIPAELPTVGELGLAIVGMLIGGVSACPRGACAADSSKDFYEAKTYVNAEGQKLPYRNGT
jgi:hypothetical protein